MHPDSAREDEGLGFRATAPRLDQRVDRLPVLGDAVRRVLEGRMDEHGALSGDIGVRLGIPSSPTTGSISCCASRRAFAWVRVSPQTRCPARRNAAATLDPTYPVAPVTNTCIGV